MSSPSTTTSTLEIGRRLVELCSAGKNRQAIEELFADDAVAVEAMEGGPHGRETRGKDKLLEMADWWEGAHEVHSSSTDGPYPHDDRFICMMEIDVTAKEGPMAGQRMKMKEACLYTVADGRITRSDFFYAMDC